MLDTEAVLQEVQQVFRLMERSQRSRWNSPGKLVSELLDRYGNAAIDLLDRGKPDEALELLQALSRNCSCVITAEGVRLSTCTPHEMLSLDQRAVDGLLFARRIAPRLLIEEFEPAIESEVLASS